MKIKILLKLSLLLMILLIANNANSQTTYIRTVVHAMYENVSQDIADAVVLNYINEVNKGYLKQMTAKFTRTPDIFGPDWSNTDIQLCIATTDPNGNPTTGITHTLIADKFMPSQNPSSPANPVWNPTQYLNIYLVPVYPEIGFPSFILGGWASTPTEPQMGASFDYVVVSTNGIIFIPELIAHEVGHYFGLQHVSDDNLADTPRGMENINPFTGYATSCSLGLQNQNSTTLAQDGNHWGVDPPDMVENFMGLSFCCQFMFTNMQKSLMHSYISTHHSSKIASNCITTTGLNKNIKNMSISIAPNPSNGQVIVHYGESHLILNITIQDAIGNTIYEQNKVNSGTAIDLTQYPNGLYFVRLIIDESGGSITEKIILSK